MHLTQGQHGAYMLFLRWIYTTGTPVPHKQRFSIALARLDLERSDATAVLETFFTRKGDAWHNARATETIADADKKHKKLAAAGREGGKKKASNALASLEPPCSEALATTTTKKKEEESTRKVRGNGSSRDSVVAASDRDDETPFDETHP
jgi:uncharacterized protein YdaU (DUF1376 family)